MSDSESMTVTWRNRLLTRAPMKRYFAATAPPACERLRLVTRVAAFATVLLMMATVAAADGPEKAFADWLVGLRAEARAAGVSAVTLERTLNGLAPDPTVLARQRHQPEAREGLKAYLARRVSADRIRAGRDALRVHSSLLDRINVEYGVQPRFVVALWGMESDFGRFTGQHGVIPALATLAYDGRRHAYFRRELLVALQIVDAGDITPEAMLGSWAGAMGQCQFMPWNYAHRAVDYDGDGKRDIWHSTPDVLASIASFLHHSGWSDDQTWGREVSLTQSPDAAAESSAARPLRSWQLMGVRRADGRDLPRRELNATLVRPRNASGAAYLVYPNYRTLLKWNNAHHFAIATGTLADRLR
jgi:membrane-bound lytic murein transglycosylase B